MTGDPLLCITEAAVQLSERVPCRDCGVPTVSLAVMLTNHGEYVLCAACSNGTKTSDLQTDQPARGVDPGNKSAPHAVARAGAMTPGDSPDA